MCDLHAQAIFCGTSQLGVADLSAEIPIFTLAPPCGALKNKFAIGLTLWRFRATRIFSLEIFDQS